MRNITGGKKPDFTVRNRQKAVRIDAGGLLRDIGRLAGLFPGAPRDTGIVLVSDRRIRELNRRFLKKDYATDILSFNVSRQCGELVISAETAAAQAKEFGHSTEDEIVYLTIHGLLHLAGRRDYTPAEYRAMKKKQDRIFESWKESRGTS